MKLNTEVGLGPCYIVLDGDPAPHQKGAQPPIFGHVCCGQTAGWIKMPLGTEVGLGQVHILLDGDPASPKRGHVPSSFRPMSVVVKRLDGSRCHLIESIGLGLGPGDIVYMGTPNFRPMFIVANGAHLSYC